MGLDKASHFREGVDGLHAEQGNKRRLQHFYCCNNMRSEVDQAIGQQHDKRHKNFKYR